MEDEQFTITIIELSIMINSNYSIMDSSNMFNSSNLPYPGLLDYYHHYELSRSIGIIIYYNCDKLWEYSVENRGSFNGEKVKQQQSQAYLLPSGNLT